MAYIVPGEKLHKKLLGKYPLAMEALEDGRFNEMLASEFNKWLISKPDQEWYAGQGGRITFKMLSEIWRSDVPMGHKTDGRVYFDITCTGSSLKWLLPGTLGMPVVHAMSVGTRYIEALERALKDSSNIPLLLAKLPLKYEGYYRLENHIYVILNYLLNKE